MRIAPSVLSADLGDLDRAVALAVEGGADLLHVDVMDGHFVPNLSFGIPVIEALRRRTEMELDVHLMVSNPDRLLDRYIAAGASWVSVHWEATTHLQRLVVRIRELGARAGVALNPATPVEVLTDVLGDLDFVLLMSVNPGFSGQAFLPSSFPKAVRLRELIRAGSFEVEIEMDGGLGRNNIAEAAHNGVQVAVAGSEVYGQDDPVAAIRRLHALASGERLAAAEGRA
ncbi:MAG: ribulose-phosphate 3-epimerase [Acidobacteriota bacterium]|nr:ribulose-phosphate 3-epimerase [Acidobacteriota bacterium]